MTNLNIPKLLNQLISNIDTDWKNIIDNIYQNNMSQLHKINDLLNSNQTLYPPKNLIFNSFNKFNFKDTKVVILGQDPYHQKDQAMGLAFSINKGIKNPPSLKNIIKEIKNNYITSNIEDYEGDLTYLSDQGVLLLNSSLTVLDSKPGCHMKNWENFTNNIIKYISNNHQNIVFILWGNYAKSKKKIIDLKKHHILESVHPSPLSASKGFFGCNHFLLCNEYLKKHDITIIKW
jgi:uracil-DNA glycosylase